MLYVDDDNDGDDDLYLPLPYFTLPYFIPEVIIIIIIVRTPHIRAPLARPLLVEVVHARAGRVLRAGTLLRAEMRRVGGSVICGQERRRARSKVP